MKQLTNKQLGRYCEWRALNWCKNIFKWRVMKSTKEIDKYHEIDFVCRDKQDNLIYLQVKSISQMGKVINLEKAINKSMKDNAKLYIVFVEPKMDGKLYFNQIMTT